MTCYQSTVPQKAALCKTRLFPSGTESGWTYGMIREVASKAWDVRTRRYESDAMVPSSATRSNIAARPDLQTLSDFSLRSAFTWDVRGHFPVDWKEGNVQRETDALLVTLIGLLSHTYHTLLPRRGLSSKPDIVEISIDPSRFLIQLGNPFCPRSDTTLTVSVPMLPADSGNLQRGLPLFPRGRTALCRFFPPLSHSLFFLPSSSFPQLDTAVFSGDPSEGRSGLHVLPSRCQLLLATCTSIARSGKGPYTCQ